MGWGLATTDVRREGAAHAKLRVCERDFNDNPDDRSLNILETGDPNALGGPEEIDGPFLTNLTEPLMAASPVSQGKSAMDIVGDQIDTLDPMRFQRNNVARGPNHTGMILRPDPDPVRMRERQGDGSTKVFNHASVLRGSEQTRASDHLPVSADFIFEAWSHLCHRSQW